ncbi:hypothetical protein Tco_0273888 [Tanacetum coccineum]
MENENPIHILGDYSKPSHEGYQNTIELPVGNNVVPLRSDTIRGSYDTQYCMENPKQAFVYYASSRSNEVGGDSMAHVNAVSINPIENSAPSYMGIKSLFKLLSPKYQSQSSPGEQNRSCSSLKRIHFVKIITIMRKEEEPKEDRIMEPNATRGNNHITIAEMKEKTGDDESLDVKREDPNDRAYGDTKKVE